MELWDLLDKNEPVWHQEEASRTPWQQRSPVGTLRLGGNALAALDDRIGELRALTRLEAHNNALNSLPASIANLQNLAVLNLAHNRLTTIPEALLRLESLTSLDVSHNEIATLWLEKKDEDTLLPHLRTLNLAGNKLRQSAFIGEGSNVLALPKSLVQLDISGNALHGVIPARLFAPLESLESLALHGNEISDAVFSPGGCPPHAGVLPRLRVLDVRRANLNTLATLENVFTSAPSLTLAEARDRTRAPPLVPASATGGASPLSSHQLVRVSTVPGESELTVTVTASDRTTRKLPALYVLVDGNPLRHEPHRRRRGGRRDEDRRKHEDDEPAMHAGSALASAKLSTKKKEALGQVPCKFFRSNGCSAGDACPFAHTLPGEGQQKAVCQWYVKGSCRFGHRCALAHILPGQPMSMDRKNKRAAQQGIRASEEARSSTSPDTPRAQGTREAPDVDDATLSPPSAVGSFTSGSVPGMGMPWASDAKNPKMSNGSATANAAVPPLGPASFDSVSAAFGTSPFSYPGSNSVFFSPLEAASMPAATGMVGKRAPMPMPAFEELGESTHAEDFLPSSLSDLLTPAELERRTRTSIRDTMSPPSRSVLGDVASQSIPVNAPGFSTRPDTSPTLTAFGGRASHIPMHVPPIATGRAPGTRIPRPLVPISPALAPVPPRDSDPEDAIFELE